MRKFAFICLATFGLLAGLIGDEAHAGLEDPALSASRISSALDGALRLERPAERARAVDDVLAFLGLSWHPGAEGPDEIASVLPSDSRPPADPQVVPLELLADSPGVPKDKHFINELLAAQLAPAKVIVLSRGAYTLQSATEALVKQGKAGLIAATAGGTVINAPIYVGPNASLAIQAADIELNATNGAFVISAGRLSVRDSTLAGSPGRLIERADADRAFRPFILVGGNGLIEASRSRFTRLGNGGDYTAGVTMFRAIGSKTKRSVLTGNLFEDTYGLRIVQTPRIEVSHNEFRHILGPGIHVSRSADVELSANLIHHVTGDRGIVLSEGAEQVRVRGNLVARNASGIAVTSAAGGNWVDDNIVLANVTAGIGLYGKRCNVVRGNAVIANGMDGISWREGAAVLIGNRIALNGSAGLSSPLGDASQTGAPSEGLLLKANVISRNRTGLRIDRASWIAFEGNDFSNQSPSIFSGALGSALVSYLREKTPQSVLLQGGPRGFHASSELIPDSDTCGAVVEPK
jgi:hypothetical protein